jgi:hypothetical protein
MKSLKDWRIKENIQNAEWDHIKSMKFSIDPEIKAFIMPKIEKIQEAIVFKLGERNQNIKSFRDVPPEIRDQFAQSIISSTLESFFESINPQQTGQSVFPQPQPQQKQQSSEILPQDEPQTPAASRG